MRCPGFFASHAFTHVEEIRGIHLGSKLHQEVCTDACLGSIWSEAKTKW